jgi:outer membrane murein-binding lipoprotein Lpp
MGRHPPTVSTTVPATKRHLEAGLDAEQKLDDLVSSVADAVTRTAQLAEPMRKWEDIRLTTGVLDWIAELGMDVDKIRDEATHAYEQAEGAFSRGTVHREECPGRMPRQVEAAYETLPDFRGGDFKDVADVVGAEEPGRSLAHVG